MKKTLTRVEEEVDEDNISRIEVENVQDVGGIYIINL